MSNPTPVDAYLTWFEAQPPEIRTHLVFFSANMMPSDLLRPLTAYEGPELEQEFRAVVRKLCTQLWSVTGTALTLRAFTEFAFMHRAAQSEFTSKMWAKSQESWQALQAGALSQDAIHNWFARTFANSDPNQSTPWG